MRPTILGRYGIFFVSPIVIAVIMFIAFSFHVRPKVAVTVFLPSEISEVYVYMPIENDICVKTDNIIELDLAEGGCIRLNVHSVRTEERNVCYVCSLTEPCVDIGENSMLNASITRQAEPLYRLIIKNRKVRSSD